MLYFSLAITIIAVIFTKFPPKFYFIKEIRVTSPELPTQSTTPVDNSDLAALNEDRPPSLDELMVALNQNIHDLMGGDEDVN